MAESGSNPAHALFVVLSCFAYGLPLYEGIQRRSLFWIITFALSIILSLSTHCEETGLCESHGKIVQERHFELNRALSFFLMGCIFLVVFEIRSEILGRVLMGLWAVFLFLYGDTDATVLNTVVTFIISIFILLYDIRRFNRRFTQAQGRRLGLITGMGIIGTGLFALLKMFWVWHGLWHFYVAGATYLLLLAQRHKNMLSKKRTRKDGAVGHSSSITTQSRVKRRQGGDVSATRYQDTGATVPSFSDYSPANDEVQLHSLETHQNGEMLRESTITV